MKPALPAVSPSVAPFAKPLTARALSLRALSARLATRRAYCRAPIASLTLPAPLRPILCALLAFALVYSFAPQARAHSASVYSAHAGKIVLLPHYRLTSGRGIYRGFGATRNAGAAILQSWLAPRVKL